jgi:hypothetical protein
MLVKGSGILMGLICDYYLLGFLGQLPSLAFLADSTN